MMKFVLPLLYSLVVVASTNATEVVTFIDGRRMEVERYEVKNNIVVFVTRDGKLFSVHRSYVKLEESEPVAPTPATPTPATPTPVPSISSHSTMV